jgi:hypothetical protein
MEKQKLMTTKQFIKVGIFFVAFYTLGSYEKTYDTKESPNTHTTEQIVIKVNPEILHDSLLWNDFRGLGDQEYILD